MSSQSSSSPRKDDGRKYKKDAELKREGAAGAVSFFPCLQVFFSLSRHLEDHAVGVLALVESEIALEVSMDEGIGLDSSEHVSVHSLLVGLLGLGEGLGSSLLLLVTLSKHGLVGLRALLASVLLLLELLAEVVVVVLLNVQGSGESDLGLGGDHVGLVHTAERHTVKLERTGDEEKTGVELLEEDNSLSTVLAGEEDEHSAGGDGSTELGLVVLVDPASVGGIPGSELAASTVAANVLSRVPARSLGGLHSGLGSGGLGGGPLTSVLLLHSEDLLRCRRSRAGILGDPRSDRGVPVGVWSLRSFGGHLTKTTK